MLSLLRSATLLNSGLKTAAKTPFTFGRAGYSSASNPSSGPNYLMWGGAAAAVGAGYYYYSQGSKAVPVQKIDSKGDLLLSPKEFRSFKLKEVQNINHNTKLFRFELPDDQSLSLPVASCVLTKAPGKGGKPVIRPYTPTSEEDTLGHFDFIIKHYEGGPMSTHIHSLNPGDSLEVKGPFPKFLYKANTLSEIGLIAGGTGITPMLQLIRKILNNTGDKTKIKLVFANRTTKDIILKDELDNLAKQHSDRFKVNYVIDKSEFGWKGDVGYIDKTLLNKYMPKSTQNDTMVFICGPDQMLGTISGAKNPDKSQGEIGGFLKELGFTSENVYKF